MPLPHRAAVRKLADDILAGRVEPARAIDDALGAASTDTAIALMVAASLAAKPPSIEQVARALPMVDEIEAMPLLVACASGDRVKMLLDVVEKDQMGSARDALALFFAAASLRGAAPSRLGALLRREARRSEKSDTAAVLLAAARVLGDVDVVASVCSVLPYIDLPLADEATKKWRAELAKAPVDALAEDAGPRVVASGFTARRTVPKVGRNDPCPCGSGKKYKKCHEGKDAPEVEGDAIVERLRDAASSLTSDQILDLRAQELLRLDFSALASKPLEQAFKRVTLLHQWELAERALDEIAKRSDLDSVDRYRDDLVYEALYSNNAEMAKKHAAKISDSAKVSLACKVGLELVAPTAESLGRVEAMVAEALRGEDADPEPLLSLADSLLIHQPALGIVFTRGALNPARDRLSGGLLEAIEEARDRLALAPGDPASAIYSAMLDVDVAKRAKRELAAARAAEKKRAQSQGAALRKKAREAAARVEELQAQLTAQQEALARDEREAAKARVAPTAADDEERRRLRAKIDALKGQIAEGNKERGELRKELALKSEAVASAAPDDDEEDEEDPDIDGAPVDARVRGVAIPRFAKSAAEALREAPARIAKDALLIVAELAAGDAAAWREVKQLEKAQTPIFSARIGIHYRMLFRTDAAGLEVLEVFHRKNLESIVKRYA